MLTNPDFKEKKVIIVITKDGEKISFKNDNVVIQDAENKIICQYTCYKIFLIIVVGGFVLTSGIMEKANKFGFSIVFMNYNFKVYSTINSKMEGNTLLREKQYNLNNSNDIAKKIIINKINNQRDILKKIRNKNEELKNTIKLLDEYINKLQNNEFNDEEIMGIEGIAAKIYFKQLYGMYNWNGRKPRVKNDITNLLLDIGYTTLFNYIEAICNVYGFDVYKGFLHKEFYKRKSLICDMIEPFRPIIDYKIRKIYQLSQIDLNDFQEQNGRYSINWKNSSKYLMLFVEEIIKYKEEIFIFIQSFYRWFMKGANMETFPYVDINNDND